LLLLLILTFVVVVVDLFCYGGDCSFTVVW
jgi:hypothetical protein